MKNETICTSNKKTCLHKYRKFITQALLNGTHNGRNPEATEHEFILL
jgi:hypothetical protein